MPFPITIKFKKRLHAAITALNDQACLHYIETKIAEQQADNIVVNDNRVSYKGTTSRWRGALFGGVDRGMFTLINEDSGNSYLLYEITMYELIIAASIMAIIAGIFGRMFWVGVGAFLWLGGMNWVINLIRHEGLAADLAASIDRLNGISDPDPKDPEALKSWF